MKHSFGIDSCSPGDARQFVEFWVADCLFSVRDVNGKIKVRRLS